MFHKSARPFLALLCATAWSGCDSSPPMTLDAGTDADTIVDLSSPSLDGFTTNLERDIVSTNLSLDVTALHGIARITVTPDTTATSASFEARGLSINSVTDGMTPLPYRMNGGILDVNIAPGASPDIVVDYTFTKHANDQGLSLNGGYTLIWPYFCGNLFPCHSDPADGTTFALSVTGVPTGKIAVFPSTIPAPAPSYQIAVAIGAGYTKTDLGMTTAGTHVVLWSQPAYQTNAMKGAAHLNNALDWYEKTYGPYTFGNEVGSVIVNWGAGAFGGMEHHPLVHIASDAASDELTHMHEAAHGWYGDGIRIACWEDFVLSEGTVNYISARALGKINGDAAGQAAFDSYATELASEQKVKESHIARPDGCGVVDALKNFTVIPYDKGALFYRALAAKIGADVLDGVLHDFYMANVGKAAGMQDLLDMVKLKTGYDPTVCATAWLKTDAAPTGALATACP